MQPAAKNRKTYCCVPDSKENLLQGRSGEGTMPVACVCSPCMCEAEAADHLGPGVRSQPGKCSGFIISSQINLCPGFSAHPFSAVSFVLRVESLCDDLDTTCVRTVQR